MVKFVSSSKIQRINFGFLSEITILPFFQKLEFLGSYNIGWFHAHGPYGSHTSKTGWAVRDLIDGCGSFKVGVIPNKWKKSVI